MTLQDSLDVNKKKRLPKFVNAMTSQVSLFFVFLWVNTEFLYSVSFTDAVFLGQS